MPLSPRIVVPVGCAVLAAATLTGILVWNVSGTQALLLKEWSMPLPGLPQSENTGNDTSLEGSGDESLLELRKGDIAMLRGELASAVTHYEAAVAANGGLPALRKLAQAQLQRRDIRGARASLDTLRRGGARQEDLLLLESIIHVRTGEVAKAQSLLMAAEDSPQKHYGLALLMIIAGNHTGAEEELTLVTTGWEPVLRSYARTLLSAYEEYALFPESPIIHLQTLLSRSLAQVQECELALPILAQVTMSQDDYRDAWIVQGYCELATERFQEALASLERAYQLDPEKPETQYFLARAYLSRNDHANALTFLQYALRNGFQPETEARRLIAREALALENPALALEQYEAITASPEADLDMFRDYVTTALAADKQGEALVKAEEATRKWPQNPAAFVLLGNTALATGHKPEAMSAFEKALELNPGMEEAKEGLRK